MPCHAVLDQARQRSPRSAGPEAKLDRHSTQHSANLSPQQQLLLLLLQEPQRLSSLICCMDVQKQRNLCPCYPPHNFCSSNIIILHSYKCAACASQHCCLPAHAPTWPACTARRFGIRHVAATFSVGVLRNHSLSEWIVDCRLDASAYSTRTLCAPHARTRRWVCSPAHIRAGILLDLRGGALSMQPIVRQTQ